MKLWIICILSFVAGAFVLAQLTGTFAGGLGATFNPVTTP